MKKFFILLVMGMFSFNSLLIAETPDCIEIFKKIRKDIEKSPKEIFDQYPNIMKSDNVANSYIDVSSVKRNQDGMIETYGWQFINGDVIPFGLILSENENIFENRYYEGIIKIASKELIFEEEYKGMYLFFFPDSYYMLIIEKKDTGVAFMGTRTTSARIGNLNMSYNKYKSILYDGVWEHYDFIPDDLYVYYAINALRFEDFFSNRMFCLCGKVRKIRRNIMDEYIVELECSKNNLFNLSIVYPKEISTELRNLLSNLSPGDYYWGRVVGRSDWRYVDALVYNDNGVYRVEEK